MTANSPKAVYRYVQLAPGIWRSAWLSAALPLQGKNENSCPIDTFPPTFNAPHGERIKSLCTTEFSGCQGYILQFLWKSLHF